MTRVYLTVGEKNAIRRQHELQHEWTHEALAAWAVQELGKRVLRSTVSKVLRSEQQDEHVNQQVTRKNTARFPEMESELFEWFRETKGSQKVTDAVIRSKANELLLRRGGDSTAQVSLSWVTRFKNRHGISGRQVQVSDEDRQREFQRVVGQYPPRDVFVVAELSLLLRLDPVLPSDRTRVAVLLCCNMDASEKSEPVVVGNGLGFDGLEGFVDESKLGLHLVSGPSPQVTTQLFNEWLQQLDIKMRGRNVLLVMKREGSSHIGLESVRAITQPPSSAFDPFPVLNNVFRTFKLQYKRQLLQWRLDQIAIGCGGNRLDPLTAALMIVRAWKSATSEASQSVPSEANPLQRSSTQILESLFSRLPASISMTAEQFINAESEGEPNLPTSEQQLTTSQLMTHAEALEASLRLSTYAFAHGIHINSDSLEGIKKLSRELLTSQSTRSRHEH